MSEKLVGQGGAGRGQGRKKKSGKFEQFRPAIDVALILETHAGHPDKTSYIESAIRFYHLTNASDGA